VNGYVLRTNNGDCVASILNCQTYNDATGLCTNCLDRFYLANNVCNSVNPVCQNYDSTTGNCTSCVNGNVLRTNNGDCVVATLNCTTYDSATGICTGCADRYYLSNDLCNQVNSVCQNYDSLTGNCTSCISGYVLRTNNGDCVA
jgi:proprotein convertase subtilisin/kexin type 5